MRRLMFVSILVFGCMAFLACETENGEVKVDAENKMAEFRQETQAQLDKIDNHIEELKAKAENASEKTQAELNEQIQQLEVKQEEVERKLEELKYASQDSWEQLKSDIDRTMDDLANNIEKIEEKEYF